MSTALDKRKVLGVLDGPGKLTDWFWQQISKVRHHHSHGTALLSKPACMDAWVLPFPWLPLKTPLAAIDVETLSVLPGRIPQAPSYFGHHIRIAHLERGGFNGEGAAISGDELVTDTA